MGKEKWNMISGQYSSVQSLSCVQLCCCCYVASVVSDSVQPHRRQPTRLPHPWDSPGKNTGVGCHFLLQCVKVKSESEVAQWLHGLQPTRLLHPWDFPGKRTRVGCHCLLRFYSLSSGKEAACQCKRHKRCGFYPLVGKIPWRRARQPIPVLLFRENHGQRSLANYSPEGHKDLDTTEAT